MTQVKKIIKYPSIVQYRNVVKTILERNSFAGLDDNEDPIYDPSVKKPVLLAKGTVKLHGCFHKNTLITLANGEEIPISEITKGTSILSYDIEKEEEVVKKVKEVFVTESDKNWIELVFSDRKIKCTEDHLFYTKNRGWVEAANLSENDEFVII